MRTLIVVAAAVVLLALVGWVTFSSGPGRSSINLETDEIKQDAQGAMESGAKLLDEAEQAIDPDSPANPPSAEPIEPSVPTEPAPQGPTPSGAEPSLVQ